MQKWEYKLITRSREPYSQNRPITWNLDISQLLPKLGMEGWELVSVVPRSIDTGANFAGVTTEEDWVFKRPEA